MKKFFLVHRELQLKGYLNLRNFLLAICILCIGSRLAISQDHLKKHMKTTYGCNYDGETKEEIDFFDSDKETQEMADSIFRHSGFPSNPNFTLIASQNVKYAEATTDEKKEQRFIIYNPDFIKILKDITGDNWAATSVLAHEIGHHVQGDILTHKESLFVVEVNADYFSGFTLYKMKASLEQAQRAVNLVAEEEDTATHPKKATRLAAIEEGWKKAELLEHNPSLRDFYINYNYEDPNGIGKRHWTQVTNFTWIEKFPNGIEGTFEFKERMTLDDNQGILLTRPSAQMYVFVPDKDSKGKNNKWIRFKFGLDGKWSYLAEIENEK